ncbi:MAG: hypothetical protein LC642_06025, partial [Verrucomicrobiaceae bacterium]|nr:hypothetical protein [Verrucomicrobiaceae bacterium]
ASPHRTTPECPYFGRCGGCRYQHMSYAHQLAVKERQVEQVLRRLGNVADPPMRRIIPSPRPYGYRNRVTVHAAEGVIGYYRIDPHKLIDVELCPIAKPEVNAALRELRQRKPRDGHYTLRAHGGPRVFAQTNDEVAAALIELVTRLLPEVRTLLIDAYCGAGFFSKRFARTFERVIGIEWDRFAVAAASENAAPNETYMSGDVGLELRAQLAAADLTQTCAIVDPPAEGLAHEARQALLAHPPATLIYVSCNPATLARDLKELQERFVIRSVTPLDMFPQTAEIEVAAHLSRSG